MRRAATEALAAIVAGRTSIQRLRENRQPVGDAGDPELVRRLLDQELVAARLRRRHEDPVGIVGQPLGAAKNAHEPIQLIVVRLHIVVRDRPVVAEAFERASPEILRTEPQRNAAPVIRAAAEHAGAEPVERAARTSRVRLTVERPAAQRRVELPELTFVRRRTAPRRVVRPHEHLRVLDGVPHRTRLEHDDVCARFGEHLGSHAATSPRPDDADVVHDAAAKYLHGGSIVVQCRGGGDGGYGDGGYGGHGTSFNSEKRRNGDSQSLSRFQADGGPAIGRAGRSTDALRTQAATEGLASGLCPQGVSRSLAAQARRHRRESATKGSERCPHSFTKCLRFSASPS